MKILTTGETRYTARSYVTSLFHPWFSSERHDGRYLLILFLPLTAMVLFFDSLFVKSQGIDGQLLSNVMATLYLLLLLPSLQPIQRIMTLVFLPVAVVGEYVFSLVFQLYIYAEISVPFYVPPGHAILFGTGLIFCDTVWAQEHTPQLRWGLLAFHLALIFGAIIGLGDTLTALFLIPLTYILYRSRLRLFYLVMGVLVLYVEVIGTLFGCWRWVPFPIHGLLHAVNPPVGAFCCYVVADILVVKITRRLMRWVKRR